jgi:hypothetical protein
VPCSVPGGAGGYSQFVFWLVFCLCTEGNTFPAHITSSGLGVLFVYSPVWCPIQPCGHTVL